MARSCFEEGFEAVQVESVGGSFGASRTLQGCSWAKFGSRMGEFGRKINQMDEGQ